MTALSKDTLTKEYTSGKSMWEISQKLNCSVHKVTYWMTKHDISKRTRSEAMYKKLNPNGDPFHIKTISTTQEHFLLGFALGIYWGEGNKSTKHTLRVTNTDPVMILCFRRFLLDICTLKPEKIQYSLICFNDSDPYKVSAYWSQLLGVDPVKFGKIVQVPTQGKGTYRKKSQYGVCTISVSNIKLKRWLMDQIANQSARIV